ncbi:MAG: endonuclease [Isosphaeraceae bacterium]
MTLTHDLRSQIHNTDTIARFRASAPERERVKRALRRGASPAEIEVKDRVERRVEHLGIDHQEAVAVADELKASPERSEARAIARRRPGLERIIGDDDLLSTSFLDRGAIVARSVCCVRLGSRRIATGFLVGPRLLLTNAHVIPSKEDAARCSAEFDFEDSPDGVGVEASVTFRLAPEEFFVASPEEQLDYALVAVRPKSARRTLDEFAHVPLNPAVGKVLRGEALNIIQHPGGAPKRVALRQNRFTALLERYLHYETDTMPGSSGAPVFNDQWDVVCLHHSGVPLMDGQGRILTRDGRIWNEEVDDPALIQWIGNEGIRISRIVADVARKVGTDRPKVMEGFPEPTSFPPNEEEALAENPDSTLPLDPWPVPTDPEPPHRNGALHKAVVGPTTVSVPITLTLTLTLGHDASPISIAIANGAVGAVPDAPPSEETGSLEERGLRNLERARTRRYFDAEKDRRDRERYYRDVDRVVDGEPFRDALTTLLTNTHANRLSYRVARIQHLYAWVDLQPEKNVRSIYSDERFDPGSFIREDFELERRLERVIEKRKAREANLTEESLERMIAALEAAEPFNCEHVVPQSWFQDRAPMQGDLHHLFTCQHQCNSFRGNLPYRDFGKFAIGREALRPRCGFTERGFFEPFMGKGKVARATLYFMLRYPGRFDDRYEDVEGGVETLLDWHAQTPVTEHEKHRNQAIFEIQGNRNPFIDHPEWASRAFSGRSTRERFRSASVITGR